MNCRTIEELIPLYIEDDLDREMTELAQSHLKDCSACSRVVEEYRESRRALRLYEPPDFDAAFFEDLRGSVLSEINRGRVRPSLFQFLMRPFVQTPAARLVFASATLLLIIFGAMAFYIFYGKAGDAVPQERKEIVRGEPLEQKQSDSTPPEIANETPGPRRRRATSRQRSMKRLPREEIISNKQATASEPVDESSGDETLSREALRIEIQTSDPSIRIIWFASLAGDTPSLRPIPNTN